MVLIKVDLPPPFGPNMQTCSPEAISRLMSWRATRSPRMTVTCARESRDAGMAFILGSMALVGSRLRSEEHTSELQSQSNLVCRLLLEKKNQAQHPVTIQL